MSAIGRDLSVDYYPGSKDQRNREQMTPHSGDRDIYGHGTVVASVAAAPPQVSDGAAGAPC